jgi:predicted permease
MLSVLLNVVLPVFLVAAIAFAAQLRLALEARSLARATFYLFSPALLLTSLAHSDVSGTDFVGIIVAVLAITLALWVIGVGLARLFGLVVPTNTAFLLAILTGNTGNYGLPVALFAFGQPGLARATLFYAASTMIQTSLGVFLAAGGQADGRSALRALFQVPAPYAAVLGLLLNLAGAGLPVWLDKSLTLLAQASIPVMLCVLGIQLATMLDQRQAGVGPLWGSLVTATVMRLLVAPGVALAVVGLLGMSDLTRTIIIILQSAMPTAVVTIILATEFQAAPDFVTATVVLSTLASLLTVTGWLVWLGG